MAKKKGVKYGSLTQEQKDAIDVEAIGNLSDKDYEKGNVPSTKKTFRKLKKEGKLSQVVAPKKSKPAAPIDEQISSMQAKAKARGEEKTAKRLQVLKEKTSDFKDGGSDVSGKMTGQPMGMKGAAYNLELDLAEQGLRDKPKKEDYLDYKIEKKTVEGTSFEDLAQRGKKRMDDAIKASPDGIVDDETYAKIQQQNRQDAEDAGVDVSQLPPARTNPYGEVAENITKSRLIGDERGKTAQDKEADLRKAARGSEVSSAVSNVIAENDKKINEAADGQKRTTTGEKVDDVIDLPFLMGYQDDVMSSINSGNPNAQLYAKEYQKKVRQARSTSGEPAIEALGLTQYYPDINQPIAKGSYSRSMLGSGNIYVAGGGYFPIGVVDARRRAMEKAAQAKAKKKQEIMEMMFAKGSPAYQQQINRMQWEDMNEFGEAVNWDLSKLLDMDTEMSRKFIERMYYNQAFADKTIYADELTKKFLQDDLAKDEVDIPSPLRNMAMEYTAGAYDIKKFRDNPKFFEKYLRNLKTYDSMNHRARQIATDLKTEKDYSLIDMNDDKPFKNKKEAEDYSAAVDVIRRGEYDQLVWAMRKVVNPERLKSIVDGYMRDENYYLDGMSADEARTHMEDIILARLGTEMEFKERVLNQKRWEKTRYWQDRKDRITAEPWTTANNRIRNSGVAKSMDDVLAGSTDPKERGVKLKSVLKEATGLETGLDQNGNIYAKMSPTMSVAAQNRSVAPQNVLIEVTKDNGKQEEFTLPGYQEYLRKRKDSGKALTRDEEIMMDMNPNEVLSGANLMEGRVMFGSENPDHPGTHDYLDVNSVAGTFEDATRYGVMYYGGDVSYQTTYKDEQGRDVETRYMQAIDSDGTILNEKAYSPEAEKAFKKANAGMTYRTVTKPALREETFTAPRMKVVFDLDDDVNRGIGNKEYGTGSVLTRDFQQGERPYDSQPMSSENASASSTGVKPNYD